LQSLLLVALTQYTDMIRALGDGSRTNTILLAHSPSAVGESMAQIRDGMLVAEIASESIARGGNRGPRMAPAAARAGSDRASATWQAFPSV
jgi:hypothetical protein